MHSSETSWTDWSDDEWEQFDELLIQYANASLFERIRWRIAWPLLAVAATLPREQSPVADVAHAVLALAGLLIGPNCLLNIFEPDAAGGD